MSSGISFSGFNDVDFNSVISALMRQAAEPITALQTRQSALRTQVNTFNSLTSRLQTVRDAADALRTSNGLQAFTTTVSDQSVLRASTGAGAIAGRYDVVVQELARAQVTATTSSAPDPDTTIVASGGTITINGRTVTVAGPVTLQGLVRAINETDGIGATAAIVQVSPSTYRLVLTAAASGEAAAFTVQNALSGGSGVTFADTDGDGTSGDTAADNAVQGTDAKLLVNNIAVTSATNTVSNVIPGTTLTLLRQSPATPVALDVTEDVASVEGRVKDFITAYNGLMKFLGDQTTAAAGNTAGNIGRDPMLRQLKAGLRSALTNVYGTEQMQYLGQIGVEFTRTGTMSLNTTRFREALAGGTDAIERVLAGSATEPGAFDAVSDVIKRFTETSGIISQAQQQLTKQISGIDTQIAEMQRRLDLQRAALVREYAAADQAMSRLRSQSGALTQFSQSTDSNR